MHRRFILLCLLLSGSQGLPALAGESGAQETAGSGQQASGADSAKTADGKKQPGGKEEEEPDCE
jgi:hypothetical protein